nr:hypothetical protein StreXyl84_65520 [Streptomyces sp. Xyl84]
MQIITDSAGAALYVEDAGLGPSFADEVFDPVQVRPLEPLQAPALEGAGDDGLPLPSRTILSGRVTLLVSWIFVVSPTARKAVFERRTVLKADGLEGGRS